MKTKNKRPFELRVGKLAITLTVFGLAILLFLSFLFGVHVGMNIETYPREIAWGLPAKVMRFFGIPKSPGRVEVPSIVPAPGMPSEPEVVPIPSPAPPSPPEPATSVHAVTSTVHEVPKKIEPPPTEKKVEPPPPGKVDKTGSFIVQVGSFRDEGKAKEVGSKLKKLGYQVYVRPVEIRGKGKWHQVTMGRFATKNEAEKAVERARSHIEGLECVIRKIDKGH